MCLSAKRIKRKFRQATHLFYEFLPPGLFTFWSKVNIPSFKNNNTLPTNRQFNLQSISKKVRQVASKIITNIECGESSYLHLAANKSLKPKTRHKVVRDDLTRGRHMILSIRIWTESSISAKQKLGCNMQCVHCWLLLPIQFNAPIFVAFIFFFLKRSLLLIWLLRPRPLLTISLLSSYSIFQNRYLQYFLVLAENTQFPPPLLETSPLPGTISWNKSWCHSTLTGNLQFQKQIQLQPLLKHLTRLLFCLTSPRFPEIYSKCLMRQ